MLIHTAYHEKKKEEELIDIAFRNCV